jgi:hypothetical protein
MTNQITSAGAGPHRQEHTPRVRVATALAAVVTAVAATLAWAAPAAAASGGGCREYTSPDVYGLRIGPCLWPVDQILINGQYEVLMRYTLNVKGAAPGPVAWGCSLYESINAAGAWQQVKPVGCAAGATSTFVAIFPGTVGGMRARFYVGVGYSWNGRWYDWVETPIVYAP